jgi:hypothetical protein
MSSLVSDVQKISVALSDPDVVIEPGGVAKLVVTMTNRQETPDRLLVEVEGIDIEWYNIPMSAVNVAPGVQAEARINFKVTRNSENRAGSYPFVVRVQAMETGEVGFAQAMLVVKPFDSLQVELQPKRAVATFLHPLNDFEVTVANLGNAEETLDLHASDPDDECAYEFDVDRVTLKPGQAETVLLAARPKSSAWAGGSRLYTFSISARSVEDSYVSGKAQGLLERRPLINPLLGIFLLLLAFGSVGYYGYRESHQPPVPVKLVAFTATPTSALPGQTITLSWNVQGDHPTLTLKHTIGKDGNDVFDSPPVGRSGNLPAVIDRSAVGQKIYYTLQVSGPGGKSESRTLSIDVSRPPALPKPVIRSFTADTTEVHQGESVTLSWSAKGAVKYILDPGNIQLNMLDESQTVTPNPQSLDQPVTYRLRAVGGDPDAAPAEKKLAIQVVPKTASIAVVDRFVVSPKQVYIGDRVHLRWSVRRAQSVSIVDPQSGTTLGSGLSSSGSLEVTVSQPTTFTLTAQDNLNNAVTQHLTVTPQVRPVAPPPEPNVPQPNAPGTNVPQDGATPPNPATGGEQQPQRP